MIKLTLKDIVDAQQALIKLTHLNLPIKAAYKISRIIKVLEPELQHYYTTLNMILIKYGAKTDNKGKIIFVDGQPDMAVDQKILYEKELNELLDVTLELTVSPISLEEINTIQMCPVDLLLLEKFIIE